MRGGELHLCVKECADPQYFVSVCLHFSSFFFFILHISFWSSFVCLFWSSTMFKNSFNNHDLLISFLIFVCASFSRFYSALYTLHFLSLTCFRSFSILSFYSLVVKFLDPLLTVQVVLSRLTGWFCCFFFRSFSIITGCHLLLKFLKSGCSCFCFLLLLFFFINFKSFLHAYEFLLLQEG